MMFVHTTNLSSLPVLHGYQWYYNVDHLTIHYQKKGYILIMTWHSLGPKFDGTLLGTKLACVFKKNTFTVLSATFTEPDGCQDTKV